MTDEPVIEPSDEDKLKALDAKLKAIEARTSQKADSSAELGANMGMQVLAELIAGIFGGLGLGWLADTTFKTLPWGMVLGVIVGMVSTIYLVVKRSKSSSDS